MEYDYGYVLRVDLTSRKIEKEPIDIAFSQKYYGGRGFTSRLQYDLIPKDVDPLGPENILIFSPGALTGAPMLSSGRYVVGGRSPLTGILGDANGGGVFGAVLRRAGYSLLIVTGQADQPVFLRIDDEEVEICDARDLWGRDVYETTDTIRAQRGRGYSVAAIGPAGENLVRIAGIMSEKHHAAARTGLGAVMGSKKLKAIAVRSKQSYPLHDPETFKKLAEELAALEDTDSRAQDFHRRGTLGTLMDHHQALGGLNTRNYQFGQFEGKEKIDNEALKSGYYVRSTGCYRCTLTCDQYCKVEEGEYAGVEVGGPEYSTAAALGSGLGNDNLASILKANDLANRYGLDTIDLGGVIALAMELYQRGIISQSEADGLDLSWGNHQAVMQLIEKIAHRQGFGNVLANGVKRAADEIGRNAIRYAVQVKGMTPAPLDARAVKVYNFRYAVAPRGADHLRISAPGGYALDKLPLSEAADKLHYWQSIIAIPDLMGVCKFAYTYYTETIERTLHKVLTLIPGLYSAATGNIISGEDLIEAGVMVTNIERAHNVRLGLTAKDDTLPPRFTEDVMPEGPAQGKVYDILEPMKQAWYVASGWDPVTGIPHRRTLENLGLEDIAEDLEKNGIQLT
ncbi:MAG: aldehyde ferredoxin oxidoreductase family protein [Anaerolineales bacterium]|jgi:aldehyde:ferredoxin oxidoreductase|nr:aldehyde ferredoxin oxidoreductase family protein [Anaerolineales bacterium]